MVEADHAEVRSSVEEIVVQGIGREQGRVDEELFGGGDRIEAEEVEDEECGHCTAIIVAWDLKGEYVSIMAPERRITNELIAYPTDTRPEVCVDNFPNLECGQVWPVPVVECKRHGERRLVSCQEVSLREVVHPNVHRHEIKRYCGALIK